MPAVVNDSMVEGHFTENQLYQRSLFFNDHKMLLNGNMLSGAVDMCYLMETCLEWMACVLLNGNISRVVDMCYLMGTCLQWLTCVT